jgi:hypothetical protein
VFDAFFFVFQEKPSVFVERDFSSLVDVSIEYLRDVVGSGKLLGIHYVGLTSPEADFLGCDAVVKELS